DWPLHLGVTEAGPAFQGTIKSSVAFGILLGEGIGDTIRVSLSAPPVEEVKVGNQILQSLNLKPRKLDIVSCPSCGRAQVDVYKLADEVTEGLKHLEVPLRVAVMGCVVNGPGEAREADLGVASGNGKGQIFVKGEVIRTVPEADIVETLLAEANRIAAEMGEEAPSSGAPPADLRHRPCPGGARPAPGGPVATFQLGGRRPWSRRDPVAVARGALGRRRTGIPLEPAAAAGRRPGGLAPSRPGRGARRGL